MRISLIMLGLGLLLTALAGHTMAQTEANGLEDLSLEELMNVPVVSAGKKSTRLGNTPSAVHVITAEDIRRFGFVSVPEALRLVPGVNVARINAGSYAVSIRGWNGRFAEKILVMIDGRSVYTPLYSGVFWEFQDVVMEDIERIEVVLGPGGTIWGANAVNGVINIITKNSGRTVGGLATASYGDFDEFQGVLRFGLASSGANHLRGFAKYKTTNPADGLDTENLRDAGWLSMAGFRGDLALDDSQELSVQGRYNQGSFDQTDTYFTGLVPPFTATSEGESTIQTFALMGKWSKILSENSNLSFQAFWDREELSYVSLGVLVQRLDLEFNQRTRTGRHEIVWGAGYRLIESDFASTFTINFDTPKYQDWILNGFVQDQINLVPSKLDLVAGLKWEYATLSGKPELQPNLRLLWQISPGETLWGSVARSTRSPSIGERRINVTVGMMPAGSLAPDAPVARLVYRGNEDFQSEVTTTMELGYRHNLTTWLGLDGALYFSRVDGLAGMGQGDPELSFLDGNPYLLVPLPAENAYDSDNWGGELAMDLRPHGNWRLRTAWSYQDWTTALKGDHTENNTLPITNDTPHHQFHLWSSLDFLSDFNLESVWRYVDPIATLEIPAYHELDLRLGCRLRPDLEVALAGHNLLQEGHIEFRSEDFIASHPAAIPRSWLATLRWEF